jgi:hypothetical protein
MKLLLSKNEFGQLVPVYDTDKELLKKIKIGEIKAFECKNPRSLFFHKKFMALCNLVLQNQSKYNNIKQILHIVKLGIYWYDIVVKLDGTESFDPKSINFENCEQHEFEKVYQDAVNFFLQSGIIETNKEDIENEIINYF